MITECEKLSGRSVTTRRQLLDQVDFKVTIPKGDDLLQFEISAEKLITSSRPIEQIKVKYDGELPDLYPIKYTISLPKKNIYTTETFYRKTILTLLNNRHSSNFFIQLLVIGLIVQIPTQLLRFSIRNWLGICMMLELQQINFRVAQC